MSAGTRRAWLLAALLLAAPALAREPAAPLETSAPVSAYVQAMFTPGDDIAGEIIHAIHQARRQVLVQAYSFTHDGIARALIQAHRRGVEVKVIADREQTEKMRRGQVPGLAHAGVPVWLDSEHLGAHNKVMVIDAGTPAALIITGSYNFTRAAQHKNAENVVFIRGSPTLTQRYVRNWEQHLAHSRPFPLH